MARRISAATNNIAQQQHGTRTTTNDSDQKPSSCKCFAALYCRVLYVHIITHHTCHANACTSHWYNHRKTHIFITLHTSQTRNSWLTSDKIYNNLIGPIQAIYSAYNFAVNCSFFHKTFVLYLSSAIAKKICLWAKWRYSFYNTFSANAEKERSLLKSTILSLGSRTSTFRF